MGCDFVLDAVKQNGAALARAAAKFRAKCQSALEASRQRSGLFRCEIMQLDAMPDIERCVARIRDQICRCGDAKQAKSELLHGRIFDARMIALSECREELIGAERKASDHIQFIKKQDEAFFNSREHDFTDGLEPALDRA